MWYNKSITTKERPKGPRMTKEVYKDIKKRFERVNELRDTLLEAKHYLDCRNERHQIVINSLEWVANSTMRDLELEVDLYSWNELEALGQEKEMDLLFEISVYIIKHN